MQAQVRTRVSSEIQNQFIFHLEFSLSLKIMLRRPFSSCPSLSLLDIQNHFATLLPCQKGIEATQQTSSLPFPSMLMVTPSEGQSPAPLIATAATPSSGHGARSTTAVPAVRSRRLLFHDSDLTASSLELTDLEESEPDFTRDDLSSSFMDVESPPPL